jgi:Zn-finger nucleic acid-binding protein
MIKTNSLKCPVCNKTLKTITFGNQEIDLCLVCGGIWFDKGELLGVINSLLAQNKVDPQTVKEAYRKKIIHPDTLQQIQRKCPRCNMVMQLRNYSYDSNIIVDICSRCNGVWTDKGEMLAIATYIKGNPKIDSFAKALVGELAQYQKTRGDTGKIAAVLLSLSYLGAAYFFEGAETLFRVLLFLIMPLACIFWGDALGSMTGVRFRLTLACPVVTKPTPGVFVAFIGWVLLILPLVVSVYYLLTGR